jgi:serine/threonine protein phosphatase 1
MRCFVIGDIHGCLAELKCLIDKLPLKTGDRIVFLGDYIDRGPDSKGVVSYLIDLQRQAAYDLVFLKGNHEDMLLSYLGLGGQHGEVFLPNGGKPTVESYGVSTTAPDPAELLLRIPAAHLDFYRQLKIFYLMPPFLCVHAGIHPAKALEEQSEIEMLWIRNQFIYRAHRLPYTVLFGHTPQHEVFWDLPYKIGLDIGLVYGNLLSCLDTGAKMLYQIKRGKKSVKQISIEKKMETRSPLWTP